MESKIRRPPHPKYSSNQFGKSALAVQADKALAEARKLPPGDGRLNALKRAGELRNEAILRELTEADDRAAA